MRDGYYAVWQGHEYSASPDNDQVRLYATEPVPGFTPAAPGRFVAVVPVSVLDNLLYVVTRCRWRGEPFQILGEHEGWLRVEYTGGKAPVAEKLGLERFDRGVYQTWAPSHEVTEIQEELYR
jgi:hypothetical protein